MRNDESRQPGAACFFLCWGLLVEHVDVEVVVGHLDVIGGEGGAEVFVQGVVRAPVVLRLRPAADAVLNGAAAVAGEVRLRRRLLQHVGRCRHSLHAGGLYRVGGGVVGGGDVHHHAAATHGGVVDDAGGGQLLVGQHDELPVAGLHLRVVQGDLAHHAHGAGDLDLVADVEGVGGQDHQSARHVAQDVLRRQRYAQRQHRHQCRHRRGVQSQRARRDDARQNVEHHLDGGQNDLAQAVVELFAPVQQLFCQLQQQPRYQQADQQRQNCREYVAEAVTAQLCLQDLFDLLHGASPLSLRFRYKRNAACVGGISVVHGQLSQPSVAAAAAGFFTGTSSPMTT